MIKEFNSLKGILALMIFFCHCPIDFGWKPAFGIIAVTIFFVLSGFLSAIGYRDRIQEPSFSIKHYIIGKCIKFYPLHLIFFFTAIPLTLLGLIKGFTDWRDFLASFVLNAALLQSVIPIESFFFSFNFVSWFLSDTLIFVVCFPYIIRWIQSASLKKRLCVTIIISAIYSLSWALIPSQYTQHFFYINPLFRIVDFIVGVQCGLWFLKLRDRITLKYFIVRYSTVFHCIGAMLLVLLTYMATFNEQICLHSVIYMPLVCLSLIIIGLNGGGIYQISLCRSLDQSVLHSSYPIKLY